MDQPSIFGPVYRVVRSLGRLYGAAGTLFFLSLLLPWVFRPGLFLEHPLDVSSFLMLLFALLSKLALVFGRVKKALCALSLLFFCLHLTALCLFMVMDLLPGDAGSLPHWAWIVVFGLLFNFFCLGDVYYLFYFEEKG